MGKCSTLSFISAYIFAQNTMLQQELRYNFNRGEVRLDLVRFLKEGENVKEGLHPKYHKATITCACGESFEIGSTKQSLRVELCSKCHPFFTGKQRTVFTTGRVERFKSKYGLQ